MKKLLVLISALSLLASCFGGGKVIESQLASMTLEEKVGQMFVVRPEALDTVCWTQDKIQSRNIVAVTDSMRLKALKYPMGGIIILDHNIVDPQQLQKFTKELHALPGKPLIYIDEEGGRVLRVASNPAFNLMKEPSLQSMAAMGKTSTVYEAGMYIGSYLAKYGIDVNLAPVADVNTNPYNVVIGDRAFSTDPNVAAPMVKNFIKGLQRTGVIGCIKHFPGHGDTLSDTNYGYAMSRKSWEEIRNCEMIPFRAGIKAGAKIVLVAHISLPNVLKTNIPASMSATILQDKLRGEMGYNGIIMTDSMGMGAIVKQYAVQDACIMAIKAGADMLLCVPDYPTVFNAIVSAVRSGEIPESRIDESVRRILTLKSAHKGW